MKYPNIKFGEVEEVWNRFGGPEGVASFLRGELKVVETNPLLKWAGSIQVPFFREFSAKEAFAGYSCGKNFREWFLAGDGTIAGGKHVWAYDLQRASVNSSIISAGGEAEVETSIIELWWISNEQRKRMTTVLLMNEKSNVFYCRDSGGVLRLVVCQWLFFSDGWFVDAYNISNPNPLRSGYRVFSHKRL